jgi:hypothetical protein
MLSEKIQTNSTRFVNSSELVASITIAADATIELYDVLVTTSKGKRGIGIELFSIQESSSRGISKEYEMTVLGKLASSNFACYGSLINELGHVAGWCGYNGFYWSPGTGMVDLGPGEQLGFYEGLSDGGPNGPIFVGKTAQYGPTVWDPAASSIPSPLPGFSTGGCAGGSAGGVNSAGDLVAGWACAIVYGEATTLPVIWRRNGSGWADPEVLPMAPGRSSGAAYQMSSNGVIVGYLRPYTTPTIFDLFVWFPPYTSPPEPLSFGPFSNIWVEGINDSGDAAGSGEGHHVVFWKRNAGGWDVFEIDDTGSAKDINNYGEIVGNWKGGPRVWSSGVSTYLDPRTAAYAINETGAVAGRDTKGRAVKWEPTP